MGVACHFNDIFAVCLENQRVNTASLFRRELHHSGLPTSQRAWVGFPQLRQPPWPRHPTRGGGRVEDALWGCSSVVSVKQGCSPESCQCCTGWGEQPTASPCCTSGGFLLFLAKLPCRAAESILGRVSEPRGEEGGTGDCPLSLLLLLKLCWSRRCGSPELVAQQPESINMLCRKCRGSPSCCQREGRRLRVTQDPTPAWHPVGPTPSSPNPPLATVLYPFLLLYNDLERVSPNPSGKVSPCPRTLLLWGFCF